MLLNKHTSRNLILQKKEQLMGLILLWCVSLVLHTSYNEGITKWCWNDKSLDVAMPHRQTFSMTERNHRSLHFRLSHLHNHTWAATKGACSWKCQGWLPAFSCLLSPSFLALLLHVSQFISYVLLLLNSITKIFFFSGALKQCLSKVISASVEEESSRLEYGICSPHVKM